MQRTGAGLEGAISGVWERSETYLGATPVFKFEKQQSEVEG